jgi:hypothetical protein
VGFTPSTIVISVATATPIKPRRPFAFLLKRSGF